jgi:predicted nuclease of restriction endonuclease-like RecB superfamily
VFALAAQSHPLVIQAEGLFESTESKVKSEIAKTLESSWDEISENLFADVPDFHRLKSFNGFPDAHSLLSSYNVGQVQVALFDATKLRIHATQDYKAILRYAKLAGLMHTITRRDDGTYTLELDGPASVFRETKRYGVRMAEFIPGLLSCHGWTMEAELRRSGSRIMRLSLRAKDGLSSKTSSPQEFDSSVEESFARKWGTEVRDGWRLERETEILTRGQHCFFPDFTFVHESGLRLPMEVIGFWTPEYLTAKRQTLELFAEQQIVLAIKAPLADQFRPIGLRVVEFKSVLKVGMVLEILNAVFESR